jgi:mannose-6-phosphate isomerase-like protein (cupin superfamily)
MSTHQPNPTTAVVVAHGQAEILAFPDGSMMRLLADGFATGGRLSIHHTTLRDGADGASPHHHAGATEVLYILSGSAQILVDEQFILAAKGDLAVVPPGTVHAFAAAPGSDVELLVTQTPGMDRFDVFRRLLRVATGVERPGAVSDDQHQFDIHADESPTWRDARSLNPTLTTRQTKDTP